MQTVIQALHKILAPQQILSGSALHERFYHIWEVDKPLDGIALVFPKTTEEVAAICKICTQYQQSMVVHGGLTNLVGSTKTSANDLVISMEKMNQIEEVDVKSRTMTVQAGAILSTVQEAAKDRDLLFPLNFGAKGSAQIGGCIANNAGGLRVLKFGMTRNLVLGLEVVLPDGRVVSSMKKIIKDNSGYDLKQFFIGSEGTLGIITKAVLKLKELPKSRNSAFVGFNDFEKVIAFLKFADKQLAGTLSGYELIWKDTYQALTSPPSTLKPVLPYDYEFYVLIESLGANQKKDADQMQALLVEALEADIVMDAALAYTNADLQWFWNIREDVGTLNTLCQYPQHFDISIPIGKIGEYVASVKKELSTQLAIEKAFAFGHLADGNIHLVIGKAAADLKNKVNDIVYAPIQRLQGSVSAEHGIGLDKKAYLPLCRTAVELDLMRNLKNTFDPLNILNPHRII